MLDAQPAARRPLDPPVLCLIRRLARGRAAVVRAIAALAAGAAFAACAAPPGPAAEVAGPRAPAGPTGAADGPDDADGCPDAAPPDAGAALAHSAIFEDLPCVAGAWITAPRECACPAPRDDGYTAECAAPDCKEVDLLLMMPEDEAYRATLRLSARARRISAAGEPREGTWEYLDDGELRLEFDGNAVYTPTECDRGQLQGKAQPLRRRPPPALDAAIFWAWFTGEWTDVPYLAR